MSGVNEIRSTFLNYFHERGHEIVASGPLVPRNDPTLMFTNAGMVQFKNVFTGVEKRPYTRAVSSQKCVRAGGKHNDLDNVGYTARHHTFFEMLGNFSFGDYFKDVAIELAWNLITKELGLPAERLIATVYAEDDEAYDLWKKVAGLPESRIIRIDTDDNFWAMGEIGPCGPCSEIFYDHGEHIPGGPPGSKDADGDRFIEIWNLVFMQYEQVSGGDRTDLPRPSIDTGMGLERIAAVLQGTHDNYETDLFRALIRAGEDVLGVEANAENSAGLRVVADHLRAVSFLIADGVLPSNEGRGYVLRRIMRRAMRHAQLLGAREPVMWRMVPALTREMGQAYGELLRAESLITETLKLEETRFRKTLARGLQILDEDLAGLKSGAVFPGEKAFKLYDTFGFPLDLTQDALRPRGISVDIAAFNKAMERQRAEARKAWAGSGEAATEEVWFKVRERAGSSEFLGYETERAEGVVVALVRDGGEVETLSEGVTGCVVLNQTPFYGESGGQVGDRGVLTGALPGAQARFRVTDTQKKVGDVVVHFGTVEQGVLKPGMALELEVDQSRRAATRIHHSATHLIHEALREVLGTHVAQKGSLVEPNRLRFDFSHPKGMSDEEMARAERLANQVIDQNDEVATRLMSVDEAIDAGAMALFGEKYGDEVRVVSMGRQPGGRQLGVEGANRTYSMELCGGTHVRRTGDIGLVKLVAETAVAAGVRRIEALAGEEARAYLDQQDKRVREAATLLKTTPGEMTGRLQQLVEERRKMERELADAKRRLALAGSGADAGADGASSGEGVRQVGDVKMLTRTVRGISLKDLRGLADDGKKQLISGIVAIVGVSEEGKAGIVVGVTDDLTEKFNAVDLVKVGAEVLGGTGGGGRPDMAQAGGSNAGQAQAALAAVAGAVEKGAAAS